MGGGGRGMEGWTLPQLGFYTVVALHVPKSACDLASSPLASHRTPFYPVSTQKRSRRTWEKNALPHANIHSPLRYPKMLSNSTRTPQNAFTYHLGTDRGERIHRSDYLERP